MGRSSDVIFSLGFVSRYRFQVPIPKTSLLAQKFPETIGPDLSPAILCPKPFWLATNRPLLTPAEDGAYNLPLVYPRFFKEIDASEPYEDPMRILMIAPEPFFQPRGTPFSEYYRARAFTELGHQVDLVTYPVGSDVSMPGLTIFRAPGIPGIRSVKIGPSLAKVPLDLRLFWCAARRLRAGRYDLMDCHEEAGLMGVVLSRLFRVATVYDMHSSLPEQLSNFRFSRSRLLRYLFDLFERWTIRGSDAVIVICPYLQERVARVDGGRPCFLIENSPLAESGTPVSQDDVARLRRRLGLEGAAVVLYTGTFEAYQGFDLLFDAIRAVVDEEPRARLLMVGGNSGQVQEAEALVRHRGLEDKVIFTGQRPPSEMTLYLAAGDILVSPRSRGTNTPLKIYSYLQAGKAIVATRLVTHTQVLDDEVALLTEPRPEAFAEGILALLRDPARAARLAERARLRAEERYSYQRYLESTERVFEYLRSRRGTVRIGTGHGTR